MNRLFKGLVVLAVTALVASAAYAQAPPWTYIEAGYLNVDPDDLEGSGDNWFAGATIGILNNFHASGRYITGDFAENVDFSFWQLAGGVHGLLGEPADLFAEAAWNDVEIENESDSAVGINAGIRWMVLPVLELDGIVHWADYDDLSDDPTYEARAIVNVWRIGIGGAIEFGDDADQYSIFARFAFGQK